MHVVTVVDPTGAQQTAIHLNLADVQGTGETSGGLYIGNGAVKVLVPPTPIDQFSAGFTLEPTNGCASMPLNLNFTLQFNANGNLLADGSSVSLGGGG